MGNYQFDFKQFTIKQERTAMKVGTDGVLLGSWVEPASSTRFLDIGTGTGLIALMLAQRYVNATIDAIEIDHDAAEEAKQNVANSPWADRINVIETSLNDYYNVSNIRYHLIVTNPPFYNATLKPEDDARAAARHFDSLPFKDIARYADKYLTEDGRLAVIYPTNCEENVMLGAAYSSLKYIKVCDVCTKEGKPAKRRMVLFGKKSEGVTVKEKIMIRNSDNEYTNEYRALTEAFYKSLK